MFLGREKELESLLLLLNKPTSSLVACRGRRRIGKSTLFGEFARRNRTEFIVVEIGQAAGSVVELRAKSAKSAKGKSGKRVKYTPW